MRRCYCETHYNLRQYLATFVDAYNFAKRGKTLIGLTPFEYVSRILDREAEAVQAFYSPSLPGTDHLGAPAQADVARFRRRPEPQAAHAHSVGKLYLAKIAATIGQR